MTIRRDGVAISQRALVDTGAQAWLLADQTFCARLAQAWSLPKTVYDKPVTVKGFENIAIQSIQSSITANFQIQGRTFYDTPLLETNLGDRQDF